MPESVNINTEKLIQAATEVADRLAAAALPPADALPAGLAPSLADLAAAGVDEILQRKIGAASAGLAKVGPLLNGLVARASTGVRAQDADNASRIESVVDDDASSASTCRR